jgi:hypothetical protein
MSKEQFTPDASGIFEEYYDHEHLSQNKQEKILQLIESSFSNNKEIEDDPIIRGLINSVIVKLADLRIEYFKIQEFRWASDSTPEEKKELAVCFNSPEKVHKLLNNIKQRFLSNPNYDTKYRSNPLIWDRVKRSILSNIWALMWIIFLEIHDHHPRVSFFPADDSTIADYKPCLKHGFSVATSNPSQFYRYGNRKVSIYVDFVDKVDQKDKSKKYNIMIPNIFQLS